MPRHHDWCFGLLRMDPSNNYKSVNTIISFCNGQVHSSGFWKIVSLHSAPAIIAGLPSFALDREKAASTYSAFPAQDNHSKRATVQKFGMLTRTFPGRNFPSKMKTVFLLPVILLFSGCDFVNPEINSMNEGKEGQ